MTIQNGDVGPPKLRKSLQYVMIRGQGDVKKSHQVWYLMLCGFCNQELRIQSLEYNPMIGN